MFFRLDADLNRRPVDLIDHYAGPRATGCWIVGGGPSLTMLPLDRIADSMAPVFAVNLAGSRLLRPDFWTAYDPSARFHRTTYLDSRVLKILPRRRATDLVPETTFKLHDCPNTVFFELEGRRYGDAIAPGQNAVLDWADSFVMAIDIAYRLGFRRLYLAGCDMRVNVSHELSLCAAHHGLEPIEKESLMELADRLHAKDVSLEEFGRDVSTGVYHFDETKSLAAAITTDRHYFRIAQSLRLARHCFSQAGLELISVTPGSRLNDYLPYQSVDAVCDELCNVWGDRNKEYEQGRYALTGPRLPPLSGPMRDFPPPVREVPRGKKEVARRDAFVDG